MRCQQKGLQCIWDEDAVPACTRRLASVTARTGAQIDVDKARDEGDEEQLDDDTNRTIDRVNDVDNGG